MWKHFVKDYLSYTRKERTGIITVIILIGLITIMPYFFSYFIKETDYDISGFREEMARLQIDSTKKQDFAGFASDEFYNDHTPNARYASVKLFYFDPNTASVDDWKKLGVPERTALTIQKYISKGGKFRKPEDLAKIWGLPKHQVNRLVPFVQIQGKPAIVYPAYEKKEYARDSSYYRPRIIASVNINKADTSAFISLPGIGSKLSQRIILFREKLGGFHSTDQVGEVYLLPDSTFHKIKPFLVLSGEGVKKININTATVDEMKIHPYIRYSLANAIVQYRNQHGNFTDLSQLKKIMIVTDDLYQKVLPYLSTGP